MKNNTPHWQNLSLQNISEDVDGVLYEEEWRDVIGWEGLYMVSSFGRVKSLYRETLRVRNGVESNTNILVFPEKILKQNDLQTGGYCSVRLTKGKYTITPKVHRLVAAAFIPNPKNKPQVNHVKGIKTDNRIWRLEWSTGSENIEHSFKMGFHKPHKDWLATGSKNPKSKPVEQYSKDGELIAKFGGQAEAARQTGIDQSMIWHCCNGKLKTAGGYVWEYPTGVNLGRKGAVKGSKNYSSK